MSRSGGGGGASTDVVLEDVPLESGEAGDDACAAAAPSWRHALVIGAAAVAVRAGVFALAGWRLGLSADRYALLYDGNSYLIMARAMVGDTAGFNTYHARMFAGFPALVALAHRLTGAPLAGAALGINWAAAGLAAAFSARLFRDRRVGWAMALLIPHYLMNSTMAMSEAPLLALTTGGLLLLAMSTRFPSAGGQMEAKLAASPFSSGGREHRPAVAWLLAVAGGAVMGMAGLVRPMACFAAAGGIIRAVGRRRWAAALLFALAAGVVVAAGMAALRAWLGGDALAGARAQAQYAYDGRIVDWPFRSLIFTPSWRRVSPGRIAYIWAHVALAIAACVAAAIEWAHRARRGRGRESDAAAHLAAPAAPWLLGNTVFVLCVGSVWGFECFHRFLVPALPALFWAIRRVLPSGIVGWGAIAVASGAIAVFSAGAGS